MGTAARTDSREDGLGRPRFNRRRTDPAPGSRVRIFEADPRLAEAMPTKLRAKLRDLSVPVRSVEPGRWTPSARSGDDALALLILEGAINLETELFGETAIEILGPGDPLLPSEEAEPGPLPHQTSWRVIAHSRVAVLTSEITRRLHLMPGVADELLRRTRESARGLRRQHAIAENPSVPQRLLLTLWHLADRWGYPTERGVVIEVPLTQRVLASIVHCRRATLGRMLGKLRDKQVLSQRDGFLILHSLPPVEREHLEAAADTIDLQFESVDEI